MVTFPRQIVLVAAALHLVLFLCQCETQRTYGEVRRGAISFDNAAWGGQGNSDESAIRSKFAERGYTVAEDGTLVADRPNLYSNNKAKGVDGKVGKKQARFQKDQAANKQFRTPEYLKRQDYSGYEESRYSNDDAREGNFNNSRDGDSGRLFANRKKANSINQMNNFTTNSYRESGQTYATNPDRRGTAGVQNSADAQGSPFKARYNDTQLSLDDVKRMVDPGDYARAKKLD